MSAREVSGEDVPPDKRAAWDALLTWADTPPRGGYVALATDVRRMVITAQDIARVAATIEDDKSWQR